MDNARPVTVVLHLDVIHPYDERANAGWDLDLLKSEIADAVSQRIITRRIAMPQDATLVDTEILEGPRAYLAMRPEIVPNDTARQLQVLANSWGVSPDKAIQMLVAWQTLAEARLEAEHKDHIAKGQQ